ncbi:biotin--[acetyl-CoA-carboxylase] ligase [Breoghania sp.]|uniref:biotin--[acetyl-CoA-carboxylase] ligase n=1 Tax=Breoghania sp. TaxID=2065378 RepID=UPI002AA91EF0|nr:biotin--[acetyl-CoA-carboxylase] ligase [Breoghania sp.]
MSFLTSPVETCFEIAGCSEVRQRSGRIGPVCCLPEIHSTNRLLAELQAGGAETGLTLVAHHQTAGAGKQERFWFSKPGKGVGISILLKPERPIEEISKYTLVLGVAVVEAIRKVTGINAEVKWPNDILVDGRKLCGILCELVLTDEGEVANVIAGIGININMAEADLPPELEGIATSLAMESGCNQDENVLIEAMFTEIETWTALWEEKGFSPIRKAWIKRSCTIGQVILFDAGDTRLTGTATDLGSDGSLSIRDRSGVTHRFVYGEALQSAKNSSKRR